MRRFIIFILCCFTYVCTFGGNLFSLKGKTVVIPELVTDHYYDQNSVPCVYTEDVLKKFKFKEEFLYGNNIFGDTITVNDIIIRNQGKKNEEALILACHEGHNVVVYIPLKFKYEFDKRPYSSKWINNLNKEIGVFVNLCGQVDNIEIPYVDITQLDSLKSQYSTSLISPIRPSRFLIYDDERDFDINGKGEGVLLGQIYSFVGIKLIENKEYGLYYWQDSRYKNYPYVSCVFKDERDNLIHFPIRVPSLEFEKVASSRGPLENMPSVQSFSQFFISRDSLTNLSLAHCDTAAINSVRNKFLGKEIHFSYPSASYLAFNDEPILTLSQSNNVIKTGQKASEYGTLTDVIMLPSKKHLPYMCPYAIVAETANSETRLAIPIDTASVKLFSLATDYRELLRQEVEDRDARERARQLAEEQEEREYFNNLVRKFGHYNARLISEGTIKVGFTKEMVREAWGKPYDINRTITRRSTLEQWVYGLGTYVYFEGNVVTGIQD